jgi:hypothetical protein
MKHYLVTLWNVDLYDLGWLERRQKIFERFTLPSVEAQTNKNFEWLLISDARTPESFQKVLNGYPARVLYQDWENYNWAVPDASLSKTMQLAVRIETVGDVIAKFIGEQNTDFVVTSRLDNDDMLASEFVATVQKHAQAEWKTRTADKFWLSLVRGYRWHEDKMYPFNSLANSFVSFVENPSDLKTCYTSVHTLAKAGEYPIVGIRKGQVPQWAEVVHGENVLNRLKRYRGAQSAQSFRRRFNWKD